MMGANPLFAWFGDRQGVANLFFARFTPNGVSIGRGKPPPLLVTQS